MRVRKGTDMDKKILRKLSREDLLTMLIEQSKELETLKTRAQELEQQLADRSELTAQAERIAQAAEKIDQTLETLQKINQMEQENGKKEEGTDGSDD